MEIKHAPGVYLLHINGGYKHAHHYIGSATDVADRFKAHLAGAGAALTNRAVGDGLTIEVARVWWGAGIDFEFWLKVKHKHSRSLCPLCSGAKALERMVVWENRVLPKGSRRNRGAGHNKGARHE